MDKVKGSSPRLISVPGYHLHPQYDLKHLRQLIHERQSKKHSFSLSLAPMVDMFSILVIYLLMNFSSTGDVFFMGKNVVLPISQRGSPLKSLPLVSIVNENIYFDMHDPQTKKVVSHQEQNTGELTQLRTMLRAYKKVYQSLPKSGEFEAQINLQADAKTLTETVKKIMRVLIEEGWTGINFVVNPISGN